MTGISADCLNAATITKESFDCLEIRFGAFGPSNFVAFSGNEIKDGFVYFNATDSVLALKALNKYFRIKIDFDYIISKIKKYFGEIVEKSES